MAITQAQRIERRKHIGSSEVFPIIMGNSYQVWAEKTGKLEPEKETSVMVRGQLLEPAIINFAALSLGTIITEPTQLEFFMPEIQLVDHPDGIVNRTGMPVESKSQGAFVKEVWGDEHTDAVPDRAIVQAHCHMMAMKKEICHVPAYLAYREFQMFTVTYSKTIDQVICDACGHFWDEHVMKDIPPEGDTPPLEVLKRIRREPETTVDIPDILVGSWIGASETRKEAVKKEANAKAALIAELGTAEAGRTPDGRLITFYEQKTGGLLTKELRQAHPDIAAKFANPGRHRVLRIKKT